MFRISANLFLSLEVMTSFTWWTWSIYNVTKKQKQMGISPQILYNFFYDIFKLFFSLRSSSVGRWCGADEMRNNPEMGLRNCKVDKIGSGKKTRLVTKKKDASGHPPHLNPVLKGNKWEKCRYKSYAMWPKVTVLVVPSDAKGTILGRSNKKKSKRESWKRLMYQSVPSCFFLLFKHSF